MVVEFACLAGLNTLDMSVKFKPDECDHILKFEAEAEKKLFENEDLQPIDILRC